MTGLVVATRYLTIVPVPGPVRMNANALGRAAPWFPVIGIGIGVVLALTDRVTQVFFPLLLAGLLTVTVWKLLTGGLHLDGLADCLDSLGGRDAEQRLAIMRDSRIGAFGACALIVSIVLRWSSLAAIAEPRLVAIARIVAHAAARAPLPLLMRALPPARTDGLSAGAGPPPPQSVVIALALGIVCLLFGFGVSGTMTALVALVAAALALARVAKKQIGGQTGDVLGALEQVCEAAVLAIASSLL